jgi:YVTN family beta-propeller protein
MKHQPFVARAASRSALGLAAFVLVFTAAGTLARAQTVTATVTAGTSPIAVALNTVTNKVYIADDTANGAVTVIDGATNSTEFVAVGANPDAIAVDEKTNKIYVANNDATGTVTVIDGATNAITTVDVGVSPSVIAVDSVTNKIYVSTNAAITSNFGTENGAVAVIDGATNAVTIVGAPDAGAIGINTVTDKIYVANKNDNGGMTVIDGATNIPTGVGANFTATDVEADSVTDKIYVAGQIYGVSVLDGTAANPNAVGSSSLVPSVGAVAIAVDSVTNKVYVVNNQFDTLTQVRTNSLTVIDGATLEVVTLPSGLNPTAIAVNSATNKVFVANDNPSGSLTVIDGATNSESTLAVGSNPFAVAVNAVTNTIYVVASGTTGSAGTVSVINGAAGTGPSFTSSPQSQTVNAGSAVVFSAAAGGSPTFQWSFDGAALTDGNGISGSSTSTLFISSASQSDAGSYACTITSGAGSATTPGATLAVASSATPGRIVNISVRTLIGAGDNNLIAGFAVSGEPSNTVIIRDVGPSLAMFNVANTFPNPLVQLYDTAIPANEVAGDNGWQNPPDVPSSGPWTAIIAPVDATAADFASVGAFGLTPGSGDSAMKITLPSGSYTSLLSGGDVATGVALAEIYESDLGNPSAQLSNISARTFVGNGGGILIAGFVISGSTSQTVLIRASGPALAAFNVSGLLPDPMLQLYDGSQTLIAANFGWGGNPQIASVAASVGAFKWPSSTSDDSAILVTLPPGSYTAQVSGDTGDQGIALVEVYAVP